MNSQRNQLTIPNSFHFTPIKYTIKDNSTDFGLMDLHFYQMWCLLTRFTQIKRRFHFPLCIEIWFVKWSALILITLPSALIWLRTQNTRIQKHGFLMRLVAFCRISSESESQHTKEKLNLITK